jgi:hypothetical protein
VWDQEKFPKRQKGYNDNTDNDYNIADKKAL